MRKRTFAGRSIDADTAAAPLIALAIVLCGSAVVRGHHTQSAVWFRAISPLIAGAFFVALLSMFAERVRHGLVRVLLVGGGLVLGAAGFALLPEAPWSRLVAGYAVPAILAWVAAGVIARGHQRSRT